MRPSCRSVYQEQPRSKDCGHKFASDPTTNIGPAPITIFTPVVVLSMLVIVALLIVSIRHKPHMPTETSTVSVASPSTVVTQSHAAPVRTATAGIGDVVIVH